MSTSTTKADRAAPGFSALVTAPPPSEMTSGSGCRERDADGMLLDPPELGLAALGEQLGDRLPGPLLDRAVEIEEVPASLPRCRGRTSSSPRP